MPRRDGRPLVMGVINVTPDSFSDGGQWFSASAAIEHGIELLEQGADLLDVGGESTRPGADRPSEEEELRRVLPVVQALAAEGAVISIDTMRARVAQQALDAGALVINDVSAGLADDDMARVAAETDAPYIAMHWRGHGKEMDRLAVYDDVVAEVRAELLQRVESLVATGISPERLILDPGLGFAKNADHNWELLAHLDALTDLGFRVLVGASRKRFLGSVGRSAGQERALDERAVVTALTSLVAAQAGVWGVRVHDIPPTIEAFDVAAALTRARTTRPATLFADALGGDA